MSLAGSISKVLGRVEAGVRLDRLIRPPRAAGATMSATTSVAPILAALTLLAGAGCGSYTPPAPISGPGIQASQPSGRSSASSSTGPSVLVQDSRGWMFRLSVSAPKLVAEVDGTGITGDRNYVAPPSQDYITFVLHVANATTDRAATFNVHGGGMLDEPLSLEVPAADKDAFGPRGAATTAGGTALCSPLCRLSTINLQAQSYLSAVHAAAIPIGGRVDLAFYFYDTVPQTAPVGDITYHWVWPVGQDISVPIVAG
jgi:hypothetical protein